MQARTLTIWLIWLAMGASLLVPLLLFSLASWISYRHIEDITTERLQRSLDLEEEEAQKDLLLIKHALDDASALVAQRSAIEIQSDQEALHEHLKKIVTDLGAAQSIWIYDARGDALVSSAVQPPPPQNFSDRDFIRAHQAGDPRLYFGRVYRCPPIPCLTSVSAAAFVAMGHSNMLLRSRRRRAASFTSTRRWPTRQVAIRACPQRWLHPGSISGRAAGRFRQAGREHRVSTDDRRASRGWPVHRHVGH